MSLIFHFYLWKDITSQRDTFVRNKSGIKKFIHGTKSFWKAHKFIWLKYETFRF